TAAGILSKVIGPNPAAPDYLAGLSANKIRVILQALLEYAMALLLAGTPVWLYPVLKKHNEALALGYVAARLIEVVIFTVSVIGLFTLLTLSQKFVAAGAPDASYFHTMGSLLQAMREWGGGVCSTIVFSLSALMLNYVLFRSRLIPRLISVWGLVGAVLYFASGFLPLFGIGTGSTIFGIMEAPLGVQEMGFALWLIIKGFNPSAIESGSAKS
ncbi:MAG: DUF4386 domain-containing protein, partial [Spirochaetales bacterium]